MAMTTWEPFDSLMPLREAMTRLFEDSFISPGRMEALSVSRYMPLDVYETAKDYEIEIALPGVRPDDVEITAQGNTITIEVTRKPIERSSKVGKYVRKEHVTGEMKRAFELPVAIQPEHISATFEHGMLTLVVPKAEHVQPRKVPLKALAEKPTAKALREEAVTH